MATHAQDQLYDDLLRLSTDAFATKYAAWGYGRSFGKTDAYKLLAQTTVIPEGVRVGTTRAVVK